MDPDIAVTLRKICRDGVFENVDLAQVSRWKIGGIARCVVTPHTASEASSLIRTLKDRDIPYVVVGSSSNLLFADEGLDVVCIHIGQALSQVRIEGHMVEADAGVAVPRLARMLAGAGLSGGEHICGIPGALGGLLCMNGGSQRRGIGENVISVKVVTADGDIQVFDQEACGFAYRTSTFQQNQHLIVSATLAFSITDSSSAIRRRMLAIMAERRRKFPQKLPNCGSVFVSNPKMYEEFGPPGAIIEKLGFKGYRIGGSQVSPQHANFIVNTGGSTASDVRQLVSVIQSAVFSKTGYLMEPEARYVSPNGDILPVC